MVQALCGFRLAGDHGVAPGPLTHPRHDEWLVQGLPTTRWPWSRHPSRLPRRLTPSGGNKMHWATTRRAVPPLLVVATGLWALARFGEGTPSPALVASDLLSVASILSGLLLASYTILATSESLSARIPDRVVRNVSRYIRDSLFVALATLVASISLLLLADSDGGFAGGLLVGLVTFLILWCLSLIQGAVQALHELGGSDT